MADDRHGRTPWRGEPRPPGSGSIFEDRDGERWRSPSEGRGRTADRSLFERTGEQLRSWFGDEEEGPERYPEQRGRGYAGTSRRGARGDAAFAGEGSSRGWRSPSHYGPEHGYGGFQGDYRGGTGQGGFGGQGDDRDSRESFSPGAFRASDRHDWIDDRDYRSWRDRQLAEFDRDYEEFRQERQQQFHSDFEEWRRRRERDRQSQEDGKGTTATPTGAGTPDTSETERSRSGRRSKS